MTAVAQDALEVLRHEVALANRIAHRLGLVTAFGHVSARIPDTDTFLIPPRASPGLATADGLLTLDFDGQLRGGHGTANTEFWIHARIYAARPDVGAVAHVHAPACVALGQMGQSVEVLHNSAAAFSDGVPVFEKVGLIRSRALGDEVAATLGHKRAMLLRGHGANVAAANVRLVAVQACYLEEAADIQLRALAAAGGRVEALRPYTADEVALVRSQIDTEGPNRRAWEYYVALAEGRV
jgi:HCOMODA/2-hydroxy-3-carboxy-muconic semialdehyde decarboxylase